jgi:Mg-chelatase subunit ChlD
VAHTTTGEALVLEGNADASAGTVARRSQTGQPVWSHPVSTVPQGGLTADERFVYTALFSEGTVEIRAIGDGRPVGRLSHRGDGSFGPMDLDVGPDGRLYALDRWSGQIDVWDISAGAAAPADRLPIAGPDEAESIAIGPNGHVALVADGVLDVVGPSGGLIWSFRYEQPDPGTWRVEDVAYDASGRLVFVASGHPYRYPVRVYVYEPVRDSATQAVPSTTTPRPTPPPADQGLCRVSGGKWAAPDEIILGESVQVWLTVSGSCPPGQSGPADVMLVVDTSGSMRGDKATAAASAVEAFVDGIDLTEHRVGIVTFADSPSIRQPINGNPGKLGAIPPFFGYSGGTNVALAIDAADSHLIEHARPGVNEVIVLLSDGLSDRTAAIAEAESARARGVQIHTVALGEDASLSLLSAVAGHPSRFHLAARPEDLEEIYRQIAGQISSGGGEVVVADALGPDVELVGDSVHPPPWSPPGADMRWHRDMLPKDTFTIELRVRPLVTGLVPTNREAYVDYRDADGRIRRFTYPVPMVRVLAPTATPTATSTPTATPIPTRPAYIPLALNEECVPGRQRVDVALVIDASTSMAGKTPSGRTKLRAAQEAASIFLDLLQLDKGDQAAVIAFNSAADLLQPLTPERPLLDTGLARIQLDQFTCLVCAVDVAAEELTSQRRRQENLQVMILLTDGKSNPRPVSEAVARAAEAKEEHGIVVFTIGIGEEIDYEALQAIASEPEHFFVGTTADDLDLIYRQIALEIPCPPESFWGQRYKTPVAP